MKDDKLNGLIVKRVLVGIFTLLFVVTAVLLRSPLVFARTTILHDFSKGIDDGGEPSSGVVISEGVIYAATDSGGDNNKGVVYSMNTDGSNFTLLHEFAGDDGDEPNSVTFSNGVLYGMTSYGGDNNKGTIFSINTDGSGFTLLHEFAGVPDDGSGPQGDLIVDSGVLYGMTYAGGDADIGTVFSIDTDGSGFTLLHEFAGGVDDGKWPRGPLMISGSILYGMTTTGGDNDKGTIFSIETDGSGFTLLHEFAGDDGRGPDDGLAISGSTLYGTTMYGGDDIINGNGTVFSIETDGSGFTLLHEFAGAPDDGQNPRGALMISGNILYGMTGQGGFDGSGTLFSIGTDGSGYSVLHEFLGLPSDGANPQGTPVISDGKIYGQTRSGGGFGSVFSYTIGSEPGPNPTPTPAPGGPTVLKNLADAIDNGYWVDSYDSMALDEASSKLYGTTYYGGANDDGIIFSIGTDGSDFTLLHEFAGGVDDGESPQGSVILSSSKLYGTTYYGGDDDMGTVFSIGTDGSDFILLHEFAGGGDDGENPYTSVTLSDGVLYGTTEYGGDGDSGTLFSIGTDGSDFILLHEFAGGVDDGEYPYSVLAISNGVLYGTTEYGGDDDMGTVFSIGTDGSDFILLHEFAGGGDDGEYPYGPITLSGDTLYGRTGYGGDADMGTVFSIGTDGSDFILLHEFAGGVDDGENPLGGFALSGSTLYGTTEYGGDRDYGTIYSIDTGGTDYSVLWDFEGPLIGGQPADSYGGLTYNNNTLYGMTDGGGSSDEGTIYSFSLDSGDSPTPTPTPTSAPDTSTSPAGPPVCNDQSPSSAPILTKAYAKDRYSIALEFERAKDPVDTYVLEYGTTLGRYTYASPNIGGRETTSYTVGQLSANETYYFRIRASNGCTVGPWSSEISASTVIMSMLPSPTSTPIPSMSTPIPSGEEASKQGSSEEENMNISQKTYNVKVKVIDNNGLPVEGAKVTLYSEPREDITGKDGIASFMNVERGDHKVVVSYNEYVGEEKVTVQGDVEEIGMLVELRLASPYTSPPFLIVTGGLVLMIIILIITLKKRKKESRTR